MVRKLRIVSWILIGILISYLGYNMLTVQIESEDQSKIVERVQIGGPFSITSTNGGRLTDKELLGKPWMLFFGFTYCPDVCPTTLLEMTRWFEELGDKSNDLRAVFITVDPERDSIDVLTDYISSFDERIVALRPSDAELATLAKSYKIYYKKVPNVDGDGYTMDHSAAVLLFDRKGNFKSTIDYHEGPKTAVKKAGTFTGWVELKPDSHLGEQASNIRQVY